MMIETKGTKAAGAAEGAQKYASKADEAKSGTPYYVALAVAALAAYLKSLFQTSSQAIAQVEEETAQPKAGARLTVIPPLFDEAELVEPHTKIGVAPTFAPQLEAPTTQYDSAQFLQTRALQFAKPDPATDLNDFKASPVIPMPTNDNGGVASGGGGGGGRDKDDVEKEPDRKEPDGQVADDHISPEAGETDPGGGNIGPAPDRTPSNDDDGAVGRRNRAPVASGPVYLADVSGCTLLPIALSDLLRNVEDPDGDSLSVRNLTVSSGTLVRDGDGWVYDGDSIGPVTITYEVTDGEFWVTQTAVFNVVERNQIVGTNGDDLLLGTLCADEIDGRDGNDNIEARDGADVVAGGAGNDHIVAGAGDDVVQGGAGNDVVLAGSGGDHVSGGTGHDRLFGEGGNDLLFGDAGDDLLDGGEGSDILMGGTGNDIVVGDLGDDRLDGGDDDDLVFGGPGRDVVSGGSGNDDLEGGSGNDVLSDGAGRDVASGQDGDDVLLAALDGEDDRFEGGAGDDTLDLSGTTSGVVVDLTAGTTDGAETGRDQIQGIESVLGGSGNDTLMGNAQDNRLFGGAGQDHISGAAGSDWLDGGADDDVLSDGTGSDTVMGGSDNDVITAASDGEVDHFDGGLGRDELDLSGTIAGVVVDLAAGTSVGWETGQDVLSAIEDVRGGSGDDALTGDGGANALAGGDGRDRISGGGGNDHLDGGADDDYLSDGTGSDSVAAGSGDDVIVASSDGESDRFEGGVGEDVLDLSGTRTGVFADLLLGAVSGTETGQDFVSGLEGLIGGSGNDCFLGSQEDDRLAGGEGDDRIYGRDGNDALDGGSGRDILHDGAGSDRVSGGAGDDLIRLASDGESDSVSGGEGCDTLDLSEATQDLLVDLVSQVVSGTEQGEDMVDSMERIVSGSGNDRFVIGANSVAITGGDGDDGYEFVPVPGGKESTRAVEITDFSVGDYISLLKYTLFEEGQGTLGRSLAEAMEHNAGTLAGIQYRSARMDDGDVTIITADLDSDDTFETTIILDGQHTLLFVEAERPSPSASTGA
ncbi:MAG: cadherin-like domain-containing protein [Methylobacterium sp.]|uniref:calcium-binding protein n=1 Tax=Methylobacterium sp. TaxID=409 RepID=UPI0025EFA3CB|nr:cadherin-like domain-containing protein [Methylobacterium sp.]MBX9934810.1 cadherin-like domain-containing protein [Methylobacterium sp.]